MTNPLENGELINEYKPLSSKFVSVDHLYIRLPNGNVTNFEANKTYIINAVNADGRTALYYGDDNTISLSAGNVFHIRSLSSVLSGGGGIQLTQTKIDDTNQYMTTINGASQWVIEYIDSNTTAEKNHLYVCRNSNGLIITLPNSPNKDDRVAVFTQMLTNNEVVNIKSNKPIQAGQNRDGSAKIIPANDTNGLQIEAVLCYAEIHYDGEQWHIVKLITPSDSKVYKAGSGLKLTGTSDTFVINTDDSTAGQVLKSNGSSVYWGNVEGGSDGDDHTYSKGDNSLTFGTTDSNLNTTISVNTQWLSEAGQGGYNAIHSAVSYMIITTNNHSQNFSLAGDSTSKQIKFNNPIPNPPDTNNIYVLVCDRGTFKWIPTGSCSND